MIESKNLLSNNLGLDFFPDPVSAPLAAKPVSYLENYLHALKIKIANKEIYLIITSVYKLRCQSMNRQTVQSFQKVPGKNGNYQTSQNYSLSILMRASQA